MSQDVLAVLIYRMALLLCGFGSIVMGYRLFRLGVFEKAGELKANWGEKSFLLKAAAPGTFFALFGSIIIGVTVWKGFVIETSKPVEKAGNPPVLAASGERSEFQKAIRVLSEGGELSEAQKSILAKELGLVEYRHVSAK